MVQRLLLVNGDALTFQCQTTFKSGFKEIDWQTTPKTSFFTAVSGKGYFINTTSGIFTVNLPAELYTLLQVLKCN